MKFRKFLIFEIFEFLAKIAISLTVRDRAKRTKIWDHLGSNLYSYPNKGLECEILKIFENF